MGAAVGAVGGLVAITPAAGYVSVGPALVIGVATGLLINLAVHWKSRSTVDNTLDVFPCHGVGGVIGMIATGIFAHQVGLINGTTTVFFRHLAALAIVSCYSFGGSYLLFRLTDAITPLRVPADHEEAGLDLSQHDEAFGVA